MILKTECETPQTLDAGDYCDHCEQQDTEFTGRWSKCVACEGFHLRKNMSEKLEGPLCVTCTAEYEKKALERLSA